MEEIEEREDGLKRVYWYEIFADRQGKHPATLELKVVLYLYLMMREADYGWNIWKAFRTAKDNKEWQDRTGLKDLTSENSASKISSALKNMTDTGILVKYEDVRKLPQSFYIKDSIKRLAKEHPDRTYYSVNHAVIYEETIGMNTKTKENFAKFHFENLPNSLPEEQICWNVVRMIQLYGKSEQESIEYINKIPKYDYLTILLTFEDLLHDLWQYDFRTGAYTMEATSLAQEQEKLRMIQVHKRAFFNDDLKMKRLKNKYKNVSWGSDSLQRLSNFIDINIKNAIRIERISKKC